MIRERNIDEKQEQRQSRRDNNFRNTRSEENRVVRARNIDEKLEQRESRRDISFRNARSEENRVFRARNIDEKLEQPDGRRDSRFRNTRSEENLVLRVRNIDEKREQRESRRDNSFRFARSEENRVIRARNIDEKREQRESRRDNSFRNARSEENRVIRARNIDEKLEQRESRRDNRIRNARSAENIISYGRNLDRNIERRAFERRAIELRLTRGIRHMRDNVDEVRRSRDLRDTRDELRRSRSTDTRRIESDGTLDRRTSGDRFALRNQRNIRSLDRLSRGSNDDRRLTFEVRENREMRERKRYDINEVERRNLELRVRERLDIRREIGSRLSTTRREDNNRDGCLLMHSTRRTNEIKVSTNIGDRAYEIKHEKNNLYGSRTERVADDRIEIRSRRQQLRETLGNKNTQRDIAQRTVMNRAEKELRDESRALRDTNDERRVIRQRSNSEHREVRESHRRNSENRDFRTGNNERRMRTMSESRRDSRIVEREISLRTDDRRQARAVHEMKEFNRNTIVPKTTERQNIDSRMKYNSDSSRNQVSTDGNTRAKDENKAYENNWQNLIYTMQGIYLCSIFIPMLMNNSSYKKKTKSLGLRTPFQALIKTD
ncbi:trichohyalin-like [Ostrinia nubilalis]|uniref:trichohyalin-like n=1 Tax=Ostrinia nubilalis TaxID=29057 RepID=UPI003082277C